MKITILFFGILKDIVGENSIELPIKKNTSIINLKTGLLEDYKKLNKYNNFSVAVNEAYVEANYILKNGDVVALIPPVSGG